MVNYPRISIVTPSYNQGKYLEKTILSVVEQGYPNLEYIIIDGGSTDESVEIIRKYEKHLAYWVSEPDWGQSHAINKGFARATGEIFGWLNSDDWYHPGAFKAVAEAFAANPDAGAVVGGGDYVDEAGNLIVRTIPEKVTLDTLYSWFDDYFWQPSCFFARQAWEAAGRLDESLHLSMDYDLWLRIAEKFTFATTGEVLSSSLKHAEAKTTAQLHESDLATLKLVLKHGGEEAFNQILACYARRLAQFDEGSRQQIADLQETVKIQKKEIRHLNRQLALTVRQLQKAGEGLDRVTKEKQALQDSLSWKLTKPVRSALDRLAGKDKNVEAEGQGKAFELFPLGKGRITPLVFQPYQDPLVSIIIPVHNQFHYTWSCLLSIHKNTPDIPYEVIVADDASTDRTRNIGRVARNVRIIKNDPNVGFLRNCNNAAQLARGRYLVFLNNDVNVQADWLRSLVDIAEAKEDVGMVGGKLVFPDGTLQEAGGIVWRDGTAANYGREDDPDKPEYNYVKEVDYVSGACMLIRRSLWLELGGFDERFVPAYCEDTDLAFTVRSRGYRVLCQPKSVAIHFEGKSHGVDLDKGIKKYQVRNQKLFYDKWQTMLEKEQERPDHFFKARDRSRQKKTVVFVDYEVPHYDMFAGSRTSAMYLQLLVEMGFNVKLLPADFRKVERYTEYFEQSGIEVLYGPYYQEHWSEWFEANASDIDFVFFNKPDPTSIFIDLVKDVTKAKIIYYGHDLHYLRLQRKYEIDGQEETRVEAGRYKKLEHDIFSKSDIILTISEEEREIISRSYPAKEIVVFPTFCYSDFPEKNFRFTERKGLMFVGGFGHVPNVDGILWFVREVFPKVLQRIPDIVLSIAGSSTPPEVSALSSPSVKVLGQLSDEALSDLYEFSRVVVIPLRYGAGVKGKTIEAIYKGVPFASTSIGIEGIKEVESFAVGTDDPDGFAEEISRIYTNEELYRARYERLYEYARKNLSTARAKEIFSEIFG